MTLRPEAHNNLYVALHSEMARVEQLRCALPRTDPNSVLTEFIMRRLLLRGLHAERQRNAKDAERVWRSLFKIGRD